MWQEVTLWNFWGWGRCLVATASLWAFWNMGALSNQVRSVTTLSVLEKSYARGLAKSPTWTQPSSHPCQGTKCDLSISTSPSTGWMSLSHCLHLLDLKDNSHPAEPWPNSWSTKLWNSLNHRGKQNRIRTLIS